VFNPTHQLRLPRAQACVAAPLANGGHGNGGHGQALRARAAGVHGLAGSAAGIATASRRSSGIQRGMGRMNRVHAVAAVRFDFWKGTPVPVPLTRKAGGQV
jgi:hypothetical protein